MGLAVDNNVHAVEKCPMVVGAGLPAVAAPLYAAGGIDIAGTFARDRAGYVLAGAGLGAVAGSAAPLGGGRGALVGAAAGLLVATGLGRRRSRSILRGVAAPFPADVVGETLRVMELNVHGGMGGPNKFFATPKTLAHLAETIKRENPDIVLLQELDRFAARSNFTDTLDQLVKRLRPDGAVMTPAIDKGTGRLEGTGILTFGGTTITDARGLRIGDALGDDAARRLRATIDAWAGVITPKFGGGKLPFGGVIEYQPRVATDVLVRTAAGNHIRVLSGHFSPPHHGIDEPRRQVDPVVETLGTWTGPTLFGADFNVRDGSPDFAREHEVFGAAGMAEATAGAPPNSDRVYVSAHFTAANPRKLVTPEGGVPASDHAPVTVELTLQPGAGVQLPVPGRPREHDGQGS